MKPLSLGIIGYGRIGKIHSKNAFRVGNNRLKIIIDPLIEKTNILEYPDVLISNNISTIHKVGDINGIIICSPSNYHLEHIKEASKITKNIFCEKPLGLSLDEIQEIKELIKEKKLNLHVGFNRRYDPDFHELKQSISRGDIGTLHMIKITSRDPSPPPISYIKKSGGLFLDMAIHDFDMAKFLADSEISNVYAKGACFINTDIKKANDIDTAIINMTLNNGTLVTINNSRQAIYGYDQRVEVLGSKGMLKVNNRLISGLQKGSKEGFTSANPQDFFINRYNKSYEIEILNFINSINSYHTNYANVDDGLHALKAGLAAKESVQNNSLVSL